MFIWLLLTLRTSAQMFLLSLVTTKKLQWVVFSSVTGFLKKIAHSAEVVTSGAGLPSSFGSYKKLRTHIEGALNLLEEQSTDLYMGYTFGWDKVGKACSQSHLPEHTRKRIKELGINAGGVKTASNPQRTDRSMNYHASHASFAPNTTPHMMPNNSYHALNTHANAFQQPPPPPPPHFNGHVGATRTFQHNNHAAP